MPDTDSIPLLLIVFEVGCWFVGLILFWRLLTGRLGSSLPALAPWNVSLESFVIGAIMVIGGALVFPQFPAHLSNDLLGPAAKDGDWWLFVQGSAFQLGMLSGALLAGVYLRFMPGREALIASVPSSATPQAARTANPVLAGTITFLISIPLITGIGLGWKSILALLNFSTSEQSMVDVFRNADDPLLLALMIVLAAVIAPLTEELIFRAGLFRYLRTRVSRPFAMVLPALIFASFHDNLAAFLPLLALGALFAFAYERTGRIAVPIIAHGLFNLHTIVLAMAGVQG